MLFLLQGMPYQGPFTFEDMVPFFVTVLYMTVVYVP